MGQANSYISVADIKSLTQDTDWGTEYDTMLSELSTRASRLLDRITKRRPGAFEASANLVMYYQGTGEAELWIDELAGSPTEVAVAETGDLSIYTIWASSEYLLWPYNAVNDGLPYTRLDISPSSTKLFWPSYQKCIKITAPFGYSLTPPDDVKQAVAIQTFRWFKRAQTGFADAGAVPDLSKLTYTSRIDPDVEAIIEHLIRITI